MNGKEPASIKPKLFEMLHVTLAKDVWKCTKSFSKVYKGVLLPAKSFGKMSNR